MKTRFQLLIMTIFLSVSAYAQSNFTGRVIDEDSNPLASATIKIVLTNEIVLTDADGTYALPPTFKLGKIAVSSVGYLTKIVEFSTDTPIPLEIILLRNINELREVIVSTGYQMLPKERATGSFVQVDNELLNRRVSTNILNRIEDVTSGVIFNRSGESNDPISIRGRSTIFANAKPLIVIDNFPYEGDLANINPNDVDNITVLKDAAASSIWGARAGNGVIVINTKKAKFNSSPNVSVNSNVTVGNRPDQFYQPTMSSADFIDVEKILFEKGFYQSAENSVNRSPLTPVIELLIAKRDGKTSADEADRQIELLKSFDVRNDFDQYFNRRSTNQQYSLNVNGGSESQRYLFSVGYDKNLESSVGNDYSRITVNGTNTYSFLKNKLQLTTGLYLTSGSIQTDNPGVNNVVLKGGFIYPYARLADENGNPLNIVKDYRLPFTEQAPTNGLLDWQYNPIEEINNANNSTRTTDYRLNTNLNYKIFSHLNLDLLYQYSQTNNNTENLRNLQTYYTRDLINNFSQITQTGVNFGVPYGSILDLLGSNLKSHNYRAQLNFIKSWNGKNDVSAIAGIEARTFLTRNQSSRLYGYDEENLISRPVDYVDLYPQYYLNGAGTSRIPFMDSRAEYDDRYRSYYFNGSYTLDTRYIFSLSGRIDQSNLFGVRTNQKSVPLWSTGFAWNVNNERFYNLEFLPVLKLRATYGSSGNIDKTVSAYATASYLNSALNTGLPYAQIRTAANPELRWERIQTLNLAIDFSSRNSFLTGTFEIFKKSGVDIIGNTAFAPSSGITALRGNFANTQVEGLDISLNTKNINKALKWTTNILYSINKDKVTEYFQEAPGLNYITLIGTPSKNRPLFSLYSYKWGGLDPDNGDPIGYLNGESSKNYALINSSSSSENLVFNGTLRPTHFGSLRNTVSWKGISLSTNISFRLGYYFRERSVSYASVLSGTGGHSDYALRWQKPGDEIVTNIPSMPATTNLARDNFYTYSEVLIRKGDHIRIQDINLSYQIDKVNMPLLPVKRCQIYFYANNIGILWKEYNGRLDPDYASSLPPVRTISIGLRADL